jgi:hypothetical protein
MDLLNNETIKTIIQVSGVSGILSLCIFGLIKIFASQFAKKDDKFNESIINTTNQFMQFIEKEHIQYTEFFRESVKSLAMIQQEISKCSNLNEKYIEVMQQMLDGMARLETRNEMHYADLKSQQAEIMLALSKIMQRIIN